MQTEHATDTARMMLRLHGLRAQAIALERLAELRQQGDTAGMDRWQAVYGAICELRQTPRSHGDAAERTH